MINPALIKLGLPTDARVIIFHADDIGMCQSSVSAYAELLDFGLLSSAATMVPCPWFPATAELFRTQKENPLLDIGVHLTLTSEWELMRWGPLTNRNDESGLLDEEGYFHRQSALLQARANPAAVAQEMAAQIAQAAATGIDNTHIDSHMGTLFCPQFFKEYVQLGFEHKLPALVLRSTKEQLIERGYDDESATFMACAVTEIETSGMPIFDQVHVMPLVNVADRQAHAQGIIDSLPPGSLTYFIIHPSKDSPELRALMPNWAARVADYELFRSESWCSAVQKSGINVIGMRALRDLMR